MKKTISLVLAMLMVLSCICFVSAEDAASDYLVKTEVLVAAKGTDKYYKTLNEYNDVTEFDFKAVIDLSNVQNGVKLAKLEVEKDHTDYNFNDLTVKNTKFTVTVTYPDGITAPGFVSDGELALDASEIFVLGTPTVTDTTVSVDVTVADGTKASALLDLDDEISLIAKSFTITEEGSYTLKGSMTGTANIYAGSVRVNTMTFAAVDVDDEKADIAVTVSSEGTRSTTTSSGHKTNTSTGNGSATKDEAKVETTTSGSTASVKDLSSDSLDKLAEKDSTLKIDVSDSKKELDTVKISTETVKNISDSDIESVEVALTDATVEISSDAVAEIAEAAEGKNVTVAVDTDAKLNDKQKEAVSGLKDAKVIETTVASGDKEIAATVTVKVDYAPETEGVVVAAIVAEDGTLTNVPVTVKDGEAVVESNGEPVVIWTIPASEALVLTIDEKEANAFGEEVSNDVAPKIVNDRTMLPARFVAEQLGATVEWNEEAQTVTITKDETTIVITIGADKAVVNGEEVELDSPAFIENDRTYTPIRFISENLGATVNWNAATNQVVITK